MFCAGPAPDERGCATGLGAGQLPKVYTDKYGVHYMVTQGGNQVAVSVDNQGRAYFIDQAGDLYYDTGDQRIGFYVVCMPCLVRSIL